MSLFTLFEHLGWTDRIQQRYVLALMAFLGLLNAFAMRANLSMAITAMVAKNTTDAETSIQINDDEVVMCAADDDFDYWSDMDTYTSFNYNTDIVSRSTDLFSEFISLHCVLV